MEKILLRKFCDNDIPLLEEWLYIPHVATWYHDPLSWIEEVRKRKQEFCFLHHFIVETEGMDIGFCQFYEYKYSEEEWHGDIDINGTYSIDYLIGNTKFLGKGFGKKIVQSLIEQIILQRDARRIIVQPEIENKASCNTLFSCGFSFDQKNNLFILEL